MQARAVREPWLALGSACTSDKAAGIPHHQDRLQASIQDDPWGGVVVFFKVRGLGDAVDHGEKAGGGKRGQHAVPCATVQVDALRAVGEEGAGFVGGAGGGDDEEGVLRSSG